jgi:hypothetical protein
MGNSISPVRDLERYVQIQDSVLPIVSKTRLKR